MNKTKKLIAVILTIAVFIAGFTFSVINAFAKSQQLLLNVKMSAVIDGVDDLTMFTYTPQASGVYSLLSYNVPASECYLFIKEVDPKTKVKQYKQLAYAINDPNYAENGHNSRQFCLTYHLEAGVTYYYEVGWYLSSTRTDGITTVMLRCDSYDTDIDYITATTDAELEYYADGKMQYASDGTSYFLYDISKIESNLKVTVYYKDGTSETAINKSQVGGYDIRLNHNQVFEHWYPDDSPDYAGNPLTVSVLDKSCVINVKIVSPPLYRFKAKVVDGMGNPISNISVKSNNGSVVKTDANGVFSVLTTTGVSSYKLSGTNAIGRDIAVVVSDNSSMNDYTSNPIELCTYDYVNDGIINAKDFSKINRKSPSKELKADFERFINFTAQDYPEIRLHN